jgi:iron complex outermembrane recepter protein
VIKNLWYLLFLSGVFSVVGVQAVRAQSSEPRQDIPRLNEVEHFPKSTNALAQTPAPLQEITPITEVKAKPTDKGVEIILQTTKGEQLQVANRSTGNNFIADITGARLQLPNGGSFIFRSEKPIAGITEITVTNFDANTVRITVIGEAGLPTVELFDDDSGLIFGIVPTATATQPPQQPQTTQAEEKPASETPEKDKPTAQQDEPIELVVTGQQDSYRVENSTTATRTDTPLRDIPQSIQVVSQQVIEDQKAVTLGDVLRNVSGVVPNADRGNAGEGVSIRGFGGAFGSNDAFRRNGLKDSIGPSVRQDPANIERVEVLKGPASVLFGQGSPGGSINVITKQPLREPFYQLEATIGSFDFYRGTLDFSGLLNDEKTLLYRLNAAAQTSGGFVDFYDTQRYFIAPTLAWLISDKTKLTFELEYQKLQELGDFGLPAFGTIINNPEGKIPRNRYAGDPKYSQYNLNFLRVGYNFEHNFSQNWEIRNAFQAAFRNVADAPVAAVAFQADNRTLDRFLYTNEDDFTVNNYSLDTYITGKFKTGSIQHELVAGFDLHRDKTRTNQAEFSLAPFDIFSPKYGLPLGLPTGFVFNSLDTRQALGFYLQDQISLADNFKLLMGGRFDIVNQKNEDFVTSTTAFQQNEAFSPRIGILYQPSKPISLYASYSRSFEQVIGRNLNNTIFQPQRGTQYEVGIKADLTNQLSATLALYDLTLSNVLTTDPINSLFSIQTGKQRSRGLELSVTGEILPGWNIFAGYAYTDAKIVEDNNFAVGNRLANSPENSFSLWTTYQISTGNLRGLGFGLGLFYIGERQGNLGNTFTVPNYLRTDASIYYKQDRFNASINIKNLFDIEYFASAINEFRVYPGEPLTVQGTISWQF